MTHADPLDQASELEHQQLQIAMANRPLPKPFIGKCYNCDAKINKGHYCDIYCREDSEKHERANAFNLKNK
ncbi:hypothetical protein [Tatumella citrea]|uniref:DUF2116 family Zn-ribbon domain-containing protein n=1 Tax=Tatumella citrea TaxID=53336 RepID=A0A1Y0LLX2_TATCI|nr:hypothetical protein [Tatumella citrea]ARU94601.1 hypothetical protein A7K98_13025 [Tatumella citrea]ARU98639.1 hypothetical protein A7K99_13015 [Tatumella citrea]